MNNSDEKKYDVALSFADEDRVYVEEVAKHLKYNGVKVFYDKFEEIFLLGKNLRDTLDNIYRLHTNFVVLFISKDYARKKWTNHERASAFARALEENREFVIPARFDDTVLEGLNPNICFLDLRSEKPEVAASKIMQKITTTKISELPDEGLSANRDEDVLINLKESLNPRKEQLLNSLRKRLTNDFYTSGDRIGQFGKERIPGETGFYRQHQKISIHEEPIREALRIKPNYYMTYWGWKLMPKLLPDKANDWFQLSIDSINGRFDGKRWIEVELETYSGGPTLSVIKGETVRHSTKAAEILLLLNQKLIPSKIAWDLINESQFLATEDKGWKEFRTQDSSSSLWSSAYVFRFISKIRHRMCNTDIPGEANSFIRNSTDLIQRTEEYLTSIWAKEKWKFNKLPWQVNAPTIFIECLPFLNTPKLADNVYEALRELINPAGSLINPNIGDDCKTPEFVLSVRLGYALKLYTLIKGETDPRVEKLIEWVLENYSDKYVLDTCDIAFLYYLLFGIADIDTSVI